MPINPLDMLKQLHLFDSGQQVPAPVQDAAAGAAQQDDPAWMKAGRSAVDQVVGGVKGILGIGDDQATGWNANHLSQLGMAALPMINGLKGAGLPGMFSRVDATADALPQALHPSKAEQLFRNNAAKEEINYRGLGDFLSGNQTPKVTKAAIQDHLAAHPMPELGVKDLGETDAIAQGRLDRYNQGAATLERPNTETRYSRPSLNVPGGENYQERLLTLPSSNPSTQEDMDLLPRTAAQYHPNEVYQSGHWDEPNVLAHSRFDERSLPAPTEGQPAEKGRFLQEVQSDWHQQGKERGYNQSTLPEGYTLFKAPAGHYQVNDPQGHWIQGGLTPEDATANALDVINTDAVPNAPFKESWPDLVLKNHVLDVAQRPDLNWLGFTTGDTQAQRYGMANHANEIHYGWDPQEKTWDLSTEHGHALGEVPDAQLHEAIGHDAADAVRAHRDAEGRLAGVVPTNTIVQTKAAKGQSLFYDQKLPSALSKILKPFGGSVELGQIPGPAPTFDTPTPQRVRGGGDNPLSYSGIVTRGGEPVANTWPPVPHGPGASVSARGDAGDLADVLRKQGPAPQVPAWIAHLPPEMKAAILKKGLPLLTLLGLAHQSGQDAPQGTPGSALGGLKQVGQQ